MWSVSDRHQHLYIKQHRDLLGAQLYSCYAHALQGDAAGDDSEAARAQSALSQRKSLRPSLSRSPTLNKSSAATEKPGAAMVSTSS
jgi:hypothetical protein